METFIKKNSLQNLKKFYGGLFELEILEIFITPSLLKIIILIWIFFKYCRVLSFKTKKISLKKDASHLNVIWHGKTQKKNFEKRKKKRKLRKSQTTTINIFLLLLKFIFCNIGITILLALGFTRNAPVDTGRQLKTSRTSSERLMYAQFTSCVYWGSNKAPTPIYICTGLADAVLRPKILDNGLGILM